MAKRKQAQEDGSKSGPEANPGQEARREDELGHARAELAPRAAASDNMPDKKSQWLTLKEASDFLGVHFTTLRNWADRGEIRVFRTPGGHRRFSVADLRRFLEERVGHAALPDTSVVVDDAVGRVREEIQRLARAHVGWHYPLSESASDARRQRGRQLFALAISFVMKANQRARILEDGKRLGWEYGVEAAMGGVALTQTGRAVQFFRNQLGQVLRSGESIHALDADDVRIRQLIDQFLDEVLYSVLDGYEEGLRSAERGR